MASFIATYESASGQTRTITIKAADLASAKKLLRRRGIRSKDLRASLSDKANSKEKKARNHQIKDYFLSISEQL